MRHDSLLRVRLWQLYKLLTYLLSYLMCRLNNVLQVGDYLVNVQGLIALLDFENGVSRPPSLIAKSP